jgi:hypothetical protein
MTPLRKTLPIVVTPAERSELVYLRAVADWLEEQGHAEAAGALRSELLETPMGDRGWGRYSL